MSHEFDADRNARYAALAKLYGYGPLSLLERMDALVRAADEILFTYVHVVMPATGRHEPTSDFEKLRLALEAARAPAVSTDPTPITFATVTCDGCGEPMSGGYVIYWDGERYCSEACKKVGLRRRSQ
jgi:hypothetical protein